MDHSDHVRLISSGIRNAGPVWADLGAGTGAFTLALADLLGQAGRIYAVDLDRDALARQQRVMRARFPDARVDYLIADFTRPLDLPPLDGVLMANSLHYVADKQGALRRIVHELKPGGRFVLIEYNADHGNRWVPYPLSFPAWQRLAPLCGLTPPRLLETEPSVFLDEIYSALCWRGDDVSSRREP